jgi:leucyl/phenylalanyl-tRNA--protein transferase
MRLTPDLLLSAYCQGLFPMAHEDGQIYWYDPNPRAIIPLDAFHTSKRLARRVRNGGFEIRVDYDFHAVMSACAEPRPNQGGWISPEMIDAYTALHQHGFAHSVETWRGGELVGGLYGVALGAAFFGESMFARRPNASKVAFVHLVQYLQTWHFHFVDCQTYSEHLARFGAVLWRRERFLRALAKALQEPTQRGRWRISDREEIRR